MVETFVKESAIIAEGLIGVKQITSGIASR
jgi:hypothetical protein